MAPYQTTRAKFAPRGTQSYMGVVAVHALRFHQQISVLRIQHERAYGQRAPCRLNLFLQGIRLELSTGRRRFAAGLTAFLAGRPRRAAGFGAGAGAAADAAAALVDVALGGLRAALTAAIRPLIVLPSIAVSAKAALSLGHHSIPATVVGHSSAWLREMGGTFHIPESAPEQSATSGHTHSDQRRRALDLEGSRIAQSSFRDT